jgi:DNA-binding HxlR family transcriptional regulator
MSREAARSAGSARLTTLAPVEKPRLYAQACPLACALDVLGERWTLLVIRELLLGPKRFRDLGDNLPAAGPNRLSTRLRKLQDAGVVAKTPSGAYALTAYGQGLREPVVGLGLWGLGLLSEGVAWDTARPDMVALCMSGAVAPGRLAGIDLECEVHTNDVFTMRVHDSALSVASGPAEGGGSPLNLHCSPATFFTLSTGTITLVEARRAGEASVVGRGSGLPKLFAAFAATARELLQPAL